MFNRKFKSKLVDFLRLADNIFTLCLDFLEIIIFAKVFAPKYFTLPVKNMPKALIESFEFVLIRYFRVR